MRYPSSITYGGEKASGTVILYSTKDRVELTARTFPALIAAHGFDIYWLDGSATPEGKAQPVQLGQSVPSVKQIHYGVTGGPDAAIVYGLCAALDAGYDHIGLVENDVLLSAGWFEALMGLFDLGAQDALNVGAATVRAYDKRKLWRRRDYDVMFNSGAGMVMLTRQAALCILGHYRTTTFAEIRQIFNDKGGKDVSTYWEASQLKLAGANLHATSSDWYFDAALYRNGMVTLGSVPAYADNIDADFSKILGISVDDESQALASESAFNAWRQAMAAPAEIGPEVTYQYDQEHDFWLAYPHQIASVFKNAFSDGWRMKWDQLHGPFAFVSHRKGATLSLPVKGKTHLILGPMDLWTKAKRELKLLREPLFMNKYRMFSTGPESDTTKELTYEAPDKGTILAGIAFDEPQAWMSLDTDFHFDRLKPFMGA